MHPPRVVPHVVHEVDGDVGLVGDGEAAAVERGVVVVVLLKFQKGSYCQQKTL